MLPASEFILHLTKDLKASEVRYFSLKNLASLSIPAQFFFSLNNNTISLYAHVPEMLNFNRKMRILK